MKYISYFLFTLFVMSQFGCDLDDPLGDLIKLQAPLRLAAVGEHVEGLVELWGVDAVWPRGDLDRVELDTADLHGEDRIRKEGSRRGAETQRRGGTLVKVD